jgi:hypothetical protein
METSALLELLVLTTVWRVMTINANTSFEGGGEDVIVYKWQYYRVALLVNIFFLIIGHITGYVIT